MMERIRTAIPRTLLRLPKFPTRAGIELNASRLWAQYSRRVAIPGFAVFCNAILIFLFYDFQSLIPLKRFNNAIEYIQASLGFLVTLHVFAGTFLFFVLEFATRTLELFLRRLKESYWAYFVFANMAIAISICFAALLLQTASLANERLNLLLATHGWVSGTTCILVLVLKVSKYYGYRGLIETIADDIHRYLLTFQNIQELRPVFDLPEPKEDDIYEHSNIRLYNLFGQMEEILQIGKDARRSSACMKVFREMTISGMAFGTSIAASERNVIPANRLMVFREEYIQELEGLPEKSNSEAAGIIAILKNSPSGHCSNNVFIEDWLYSLFRHLIANLDDEFTLNMIVHNFSRWFSEFKIGRSTANKPKPISIENMQAICFMWVRLLSKLIISPVDKTDLSKFKIIYSGFFSGVIDKPYTGWKMRTYLRACYSGLEQSIIRQNNPDLLPLFDFMFAEQEKKGAAANFAISYTNTFDLYFSVLTRSFPYGKDLIPVITLNILTNINESSMPQCRKSLEHAFKDLEQREPSANTQDSLAILAIILVLIHKSWPSEETETLYSNFSKHIQMVNTKNAELRRLVYNLRQSLPIVLEPVNDILDQFLHRPFQGQNEQERQDGKRAKQPRRKGKKR